MNVVFNKHCIVTFFSSSGIMDCMLFTYENTHVLSSVSGVASFNWWTALIKPRLIFSLYRLCFLRTIFFQNKWNKLFISLLFSEPDYPYLDALGPFQPLQMKVQSVLHIHWFLCRDNDLYDKQPWLWLVYILYMVKATYSAYNLTLRLPYVVSIDFWQYKVEVEVTNKLWNFILFVIFWGSWFFSIHFSSFADMLLPNRH